MASTLATGDRIKVVRQDDSYRGREGFIEAVKMTLSFVRFKDGALRVYLLDEIQREA